MKGYYFLEASTWSGIAKSKNILILKVNLHQTVLYYAKDVLYYIYYRLIVLYCSID